MAVYLVDYENVNTTLLARDDKLQEGDQIVIFYSEQASMIAIDTIGQLQGSGIQVAFEKTTVGTSNALDFQLVSYLGYMIHENKERVFYIVSHDQGFQCVCQFWKKKNVEIRLIDQIGTEPQKQEELEPNQPEKKKVKERAQQDRPLPSAKDQEVAGALKAVISDKRELVETVNAINDASTRTEINTWLTRHFEGKQVKKINKAIRPLIKRLPGR